MRDEEENLARLGLCLLAQTLPAAQWIIVDTGSTDGSRAIASQLCSLADWVRASSIGGPASPTRGAVVVAALERGLADLSVPHDFVVKIDADVSFGPDHLEQLLARFERDEHLGIASGARAERRGGRWRVQGATGSTVDAQCRAYRRECLLQLLPLDARMGWDVLDESRALDRGWRTARIERLTFRHHRPVGSRDTSRRHAWAAQGRVAHHVGYRPTYLLFRALFRAAGDPHALFMLVSYAKAKLDQEPVTTDRGASELRRAQQRLRHLPVRVNEALRLGRRVDAESGRADLLVASNAGGHLLELVSLDTVFARYSRVWVTQDSEDAREFLDGERVVYVGAAGTHSVLQLARNLATAFRVVRRVRPRVAVTTGSAIAVPFLWIARLHGARVVFIECGGRAEGKSISRRLVEPVADRVYVQTERQVSGPRTRFAGKALLARTDFLPARFGEELRFAEIGILVALGTCTYPFVRLLRAVEAAAPQGIPIVAQCGTTRYRIPGALNVDQIPPSTLAACMRSARVVVCHGGIGLVALALAAGHVPIVVPRRAWRGEQVDDHQLEFARELDKASLAVVLEDERLLDAAVMEALRGTRVVRPTRIPDVSGDLDRYLESLLVARTAGQKTRRGGAGATQGTNGRTWD